MAARRCFSPAPLDLKVATAGFRFSKSAHLKALPTRAAAPSLLPYSDCAEPIFFRGRKLRPVGLQSAHASASAQDLRLAQERMSNGALDLSPDTSDKS